VKKVLATNVLKLMKRIITMKKDFQLKWNYEIGNVNNKSKALDTHQENRQTSVIIDNMEVRKSELTGWYKINWKKANEEIMILQEKIMVAVLKNNFEEVYKLQRRIVTSFAGRALAVRKVVTNSGSKTAGIDKIQWNGSKDYWMAIQNLNKIIRNPKDYKAKPLLRVKIPKGNSGETRPLGIPTLIDRTVQAVYHLAIDPVVETKSDKNSFGFRKHRSTHDAITALRNLLDKKAHPHWILDVDIAKCFDKINHKFLMDHTPICDKNVLEQWLRSGVIENYKFKETDEGTPQGGIISPVLCNIALNGIETVILKTCSIKRGKKPGVRVIRYADDMIITGKNPEILQKVKQNMYEFLKIRGLEFNEKKTKIVHIREGFDFLGFRISRKLRNLRLNQSSDQETVLIIEPSKKGIERLKEKISQVIMKDSPIERIISDLNPVLRGWGEHKRISYHSQRTFIKIDHYIFQKMIKWVDRHKGGLRKTVSKYRISTPNRKWNWGRSETEKLINLSEISIIQLRPLKLDRNPYNLENKEYFLKRKKGLIFAKFRAKIYKKFNNLCPVCRETLFNGENVDLHHIKPIKEGGKYKLDNIEPLHQICHQQITYSKLKSL
jgi:RNA-directed DNA polymerase